MADPGTIALIVAAVGTATAAAGQIQQGKAADKAAQFQAQQNDVNAGQALASSQRTAIERKRQATLLASRAQAVGAAQGGGGLDPSTTDIISNIDKEGEYGALTALYQGQEVARGNTTQAAVDRFQGKQAKKAGYSNAAGTAGSFFAKYGADAFGSGDPAGDIFGTQLPAPVEYR